MSRRRPLHRAAGVPAGDGPITLMSRRRQDAPDEELRTAPDAAGPVADGPVEDDELLLDRRTRTMETFVVRVWLPDRPGALGRGGEPHRRGAG